MTAESYATTALKLIGRIRELDGRIHALNSEIARVGAELDAVLAEGPKTFDEALHHAVEEHKTIRQRAADRSER